MSITITAVKNAVYSAPDNSTIDCVVSCELGAIPFTAHANDSEDYGRKLFNDLVGGVYGFVSPYVQPTS